MESAPANLQLVEYRREGLPHNVFADEKMPAAVEEKPGRRKSLGVVFDDARQRIGQWQDRLAVDGLRCLELPAPYGAANGEKPVWEVEVIELEGEDFSHSQTAHGSNRKHDAILPFRLRDDGACLLLAEGGRLFGNSTAWKGQLREVHSLADIAPVLSRFEHRGERSENVQQSLARHGSRQPRDEALLILCPELAQFYCAEKRKDLVLEMGFGRMDR